MRGERKQLVQCVTETRPLILGLGGTSRAGSSSERALAVSLRAAEAEGARTLLIAGEELVLPMYLPGQKLPQQAARLVAALRECRGIIISSPAYHGSISGLIKNALDYAEELRTDSRTYLDGVPVGCIACAGGWQAAGQTLSVLRTIAHSLRGWPTPFGAMLNTSVSPFDADGNCTDATVRGQLETIGRQVVGFIRTQSSQGTGAHAVARSA